MRALVIGNSGSGKSTLAKRLADRKKISHLDLDTLAWRKDEPTHRRSFAESAAEIDAFLGLNDAWVVEGCYADLIEHVTDNASHLFFLNLSVDDCIQNCRKRPWEPHKYKTKQDQDRNLGALIDWVRNYPDRDDEFSYQRHRKIFTGFRGCKTEITSNQ